MCPSDRNIKDNFCTIRGRTILTRLVDIPITSWNYKDEDPSIRHIGPMAQDFGAAFGVGEDERHINVMDANGVAFAAIQGLYQMIQEKDGKFDALQAEVDALKQRISESEG